MLFPLPGGEGQGEGGRKTQIKLIERPSSLNLPLHSQDAPHPACGHLLPIRCGEGKSVGRGWRRTLPVRGRMRENTTHQDNDECEIILAREAPHPCPLPPGEGESYPGLRKIKRLDLPCGLPHRLELQLRFCSDGVWFLFNFNPTNMPRPRRSRIPLVAFWQGGQSSARRERG